MTNVGKNRNVLNLAKIPVQDRSRASLERMLRAAEKLLIQGGNDNFTLADVSKVGKVSIGSIYNRFSSKDELLQTVHAQLVDKINSEMAAHVRQALSATDSLEDLIKALVVVMIDGLGRHASLLRPFMMRATIDPVVQQRGNDGYKLMEELVLDALMQRKSEIRHRDKRRAALASLRIVYASVARSLGFGIGSGTLEEWRRSDTLVADLSLMWIAFLRLPE